MGCQYKYTQQFPRSEELHQPSHAGAMCNFNCAIGLYDRPWFERRLASRRQMNQSAFNSFSLGMASVVFAVCLTMAMVPFVQIMALTTILFNSEGNSSVTNL